MTPAQAFDRRARDLALRILFGWAGWFSHIDGLTGEHRRICLREKARALVNHDRVLCHEISRGPA